MYYVAHILSLKKMTKLLNVLKLYMSTMYNASKICRKGLLKKALLLILFTRDLVFWGCMCSGFCDLGSYWVSGTSRRNKRRIWWGGGWWWRVWTITLQNRTERRRNNHQALRCDKRKEKHSRNFGWGFVAMHCFAEL